jgi:hypothetical protein
MMGVIASTIIFVIWVDYDNGITIF